jgi:hypothetical protein
MAGNRTSYKVGYARPPRENRFKKGQSGNPNGRPRGKPNLKATIDEVLSRKINLRDGDDIRAVSVVEGVILGTLMRAVKGHAPSARLLLDLIRQTYPDNELEDPDQAVTANDLSLITDFIKRQGIELARPLALATSPDARSAASAKGK